MSAPIHDLSAVPAELRRKRLVNDPDRAVEDCLRGFAVAHSDVVCIDHEHDVIYRRDAPRAGKVAVVSGGGAGHGPLHGGYVGAGMLDAACVGAIFTSPAPRNILAGTRVVDGGRGVLYLIKNYAGDVFNFELASKLAAAEGIEVEQVTISDDAATGTTTDPSGRRGTAGSVLVEKIAGAAAERGEPLDRVAAVARRVATSARSYGIGLAACATPALGHSSFSLGADEVEFGVGLHGERGARRGRFGTAASLADEALESILDDLEPPPNADLLVLVNGLGGTPHLELYVVFDEVMSQLTRRGFHVTRRLVGSYATAFDMAGFSVTLLVLDAELTGLWDDPVWTATLRQRA